MARHEEDTAQIRACEVGSHAAERARLHSDNLGNFYEMPSHVGATLGRSRFSVPASTAVMALRSESDERMTNFSVSTTRKKTSPPASSQGQMRSGMASLPNTAWNGVVYVNSNCRMTTARRPSGRYLLPLCALSES